MQPHDARRARVRQNPRDRPWYSRTTKGLRRALHRSRTEECTAGLLSYLASLVKASQGSSSLNNSAAANASHSRLQTQRCSQHCKLLPTNHTGTNALEKSAFKYAHKRASPSFAKHTLALHRAVFQHHAHRQMSAAASNTPPSQLTAWRNG